MKARYNGPRLFRAIPFDDLGLTGHAMVAMQPPSSDVFVDGEPVLDLWRLSHIDRIVETEAKVLPTMTIRQSVRLHFDTATTTTESVVVLPNWNLDMFVKLMEVVGPRVDDFVASFIAHEILSNY